MYKPSEELRPRRLAALTGVTLVAVVGLLLQLPLGASAGLAPGEIQRQTGEAAARPVPPAPAAAPKAAPGAYRLRCWQFGRLIFDEGPVSLAADARQGARLVATDRNGATLIVTDAGGATCLVRAAPPPPNPAMPY